MDRSPAAGTAHARLAAAAIGQARRASAAAVQARSVAITYGTYDLFHIGHVRLFERIKRQFDYLVVAVSTDDFNAVKGKTSVVPFADRLEMVKACRHVDLAIAEHGWDQKPSDIERFGCSAFVMGSDWEGRFDHLAAHCRVIYLPRTEGVSSSELKSAIRTPARG